ncbi:MAG: sulfite exporter TauE/SafE family protein [Nitrosomonadales bacterium]|nr:sulfite exporter TauE/SafE family protein [Nitrosomonadales bacterium]
MMGFFGGPHCIAMCGGVCNFFINQSKSKFFLFQLGRLLGYGLLGFVAALTLNSIYEFFQYSLYLRPIRIFFHLSIIIWGGYLIIYLQQPPVFKTFSVNSSRLLNTLKFHNINPFILGILWSLMPCALLYTALIMATMASSAAQGFFIMIAFGVGTLFALISLSFIWIIFKNKAKSYEGICIRFAGIILVTCSIWGMLMTLKLDKNLFC